MALSKLISSMCRREMQHLTLRRPHQQQKMVAAAAVNFGTLTGNEVPDKPVSRERVPKAGAYRSPWKILKEEFEGIKTMKPAGTEVPRETDFLIVGGGLFGSSVAFWLKQHNDQAATVTVVERDPQFTRSSSMLSWEGVRHQLYDPETVQLSMFASEFLSNIRQHLYVTHEKPPDVQFNHQGYLILAQEKDAEQMVTNVAMQKELGAKVELLTRKDLAERYPWMDLEGIECGSLGLEGEGWFDPWALLRAFKQKNISLGVKYVHGEVTSFDLMPTESMGNNFLKLDSAVTRTKEGQEYETRFAAVVNCAGPWAADIAEMAGIGTGEGDLAVPLPVEPRKRNVFVTHCPDGPMLDLPFVVDPSGLFLRREGYGGHYICGYSPQSRDDEPEVANFDVDFNLYDEKVLPKLMKRVPCFSNSELKCAWAGYTDHNFLDQDLVIGPHPVITNFLFASGSSSHGLQYSIGAGRAIAELCFDRGYVAINVEKFHFSRFLTQTTQGQQLLH